MKKKAPSLFSWIGHLHAIPKLIASLLFAVIIYFAIPGDLNSRTNFMILWDSFSVMTILLNWITFFTISSAEIRKQSTGQDGSRVVIFVLVLVSTAASLGAVFLLLTGETDYYKIAIALPGMLLSWILIHTTFAFRYAHIFYGDDKQNKQVHAEGLEFPDDKKPDYLDFAYFSFVLGMTFQVSDVQITSKRLRRIALLHGLISFLFNTFIVALTINVIAGLREKK